MQIVLEIPDSVAEQLRSAGKDPARTSLESLALEGYRSGQFTEGEVASLLGFETPMEVHELFQAHDVALGIDMDMLHDEITASDQLREERMREANQAA